MQSWHIIHIFRNAIACTCFILFLQTKGFFNVTSLALMPFFDLAIGLVPDYMHGALLGITKTLMYNWFSPTKAKSSVSLGIRFVQTTYLVKINYQSPSQVFKLSEPLPISPWFNFTTSYSLKLSSHLVTINN